MSRIIGRNRQTIGLAPGEMPPNRLTAMEAAIFDGYVAQRESEPPHRRYLGASDIGNACARAVFYTFFHARKREFPGRVLRLFETGHLQEDRIERNLRSIGVIISTAGKDGGQHTFSDDSGHFRVHLDGIIEPDGHWFNERLLVEMKTHNSKSFTKLEEEGVKKSKPEHHRQMMMQLWAAKSLGVNKCLYVAVDKNTDAMYVELVETDKAVQDEMVERARGIISCEPPPRVETSENAPPCRWCDYKDICRDDQLHLIEPSCRTCSHSKPAPNATWTCAAGHPYGTLCADWSLRGELQS